MEQRQFFNYKQHIEGIKVYEPPIVTGGSTFREVHWLNFCWGLQSNPSLNRSVFIHHPNEVWMRDTYCAWESWRKVEIWKERAGDVYLEHLYHEPIVPLAQKVRDLKEMALTHYLHHNETLLKLGKLLQWL